MNDAIEMIDLDLEGMEIVERICGKNGGHKFPAVYVGEEHLYFNTKARPYVPVSFKWFVNDEWCVLKECAPMEKNAYKTWNVKNTNGSTARICVLPKMLEGAPTWRGLHKLYKTKDGVAIKKNEIMGREGT